MATWVAIVTTSLVAAVALAQLSAESSEEALDEALAQHLHTEAGTIAEVLRTEPLDAVWALGGARSAEAIQARLDALRRAGGLHDVALFPPTGVSPFGRTAPWIAGRADAALIQAAQAGEPQMGPLYRATDDALYRNAYVSVPAHPGWALGVEGSGATLSAVDRLEDLQVMVSAVVVTLAALIGAFLATAVTRPLHDLDQELDSVAPGDSPDALTLQGPREVRRLVHAARRLLGAIRQRDEALREAHAAQVHQLTALSAAVAHEIRNPLHALGFTLASLDRDPGQPRRAVLLQRATARVDEMERIVSRFLDLSRPLRPNCVNVDILGLLARIVHEAGLQDEVTICGESAVHQTDPELFGQILGNLLSNAREAGAGQIQILLTDDGVIVSDDGPGISVDDAAHLFTWFHTSRASGTGLGLPQARRISEALGGSLTLERARPATFRLRLPVEPP